MRAWANLYPWDVDGDPAAPDRIAGLGLAAVTLAAAYHAVRAVTPFHPGTAVAASLLAVSGLGGDPATLPGQAAAVRAAGATELRLYHAGLALAGDLAAIRALCRRDGG